VLQILDAGGEEAHLAGGKLGPRQGLGREHADGLGQIIGAGGHQADLVLHFQNAIHHPHQHHHADVVVEPGVDDQRLQGRVFVAPGRRHVFDDGFQHVLHAQAGLGRAMHGVVGGDADDVLDFLDDPLRIGGRQVDLVQHREYFHAQFDGGVTVGHGLGLDALGGVHHQQRAFAGGQGTGHLVGKVHVAGCVDQIELVFLAVPGLV
jgi:hypothetical protein